MGIIITKFIFTDYFIIIFRKFEKNKNFIQNFYNIKFNLSL